MPAMTARLAIGSIAALLLSCGATLAGNDNTIVIEQNNTLGIGNSLTVDQSNANGSKVGGLDLGDNPLTLSPARQNGGGNQADITISDSAAGSGGLVGLLQDNSGSSAGGNTAHVNVTGNGLGLVQQIGGDNLATLTLQGSLTNGSIYQHGDGNTADLSVKGSSAGGSITQNGDNNYTTLGVTGTGTTVNYTLNGSNVTTQLPSGINGVQVYSNGATVNITQTHF